MPAGEKGRGAPLLSWDQYASAWTGVHGGIDPRRARPTVARWLYMGYAVAKALSWLRIKPSAVTAVGLIAALIVPVLAGAGPGWVVLAAALVALGAVADTVDGALAVLTAHTTRLGYVYDSVVDRIGEACWLLALWRLGAPGLLVVAAGALSWLHEYARSRANAAGMTEIGAATVGERPTRVLLSVAGLGLAGLVGLASADLSTGIATFAGATWVVLGVLGFAQLFGSVHRALVGRAWSTWKPSAPISPVLAGASPAIIEDATHPTDDASPNGMPVEELAPGGVEIDYLAAMPATAAVYLSSSWARSYAPAGATSVDDADGLAEVGESG